MSEASKSIPLTTEQRFVLSQLVEKGSLVKVGGQTFLMSPVSPMMEDFLKAIRLPEVPNNLAEVSGSSGGLNSSELCGRPLKTAPCTQPSTPASSVTGCSAPNATWLRLACFGCRMLYGR